MAREMFDTAGDLLARPHPNCYWVVPERLLAGEYPHRHVDALRSAGITDFVDLTAEDEGLPDYRTRLQPEQHWQRFGIADYTVPSIERMREVLAAIRRLIDEPQRRVYLHCQGGVGRTGTVVGCLLIESGFTSDEALGLLTRKWQVVARRDRSPESPETADQRAFITRWRPGG